MSEIENSAWKPQKTLRKLKSGKIAPDLAKNWFPGEKFWFPVPKSSSKKTESVEKCQKPFFWVQSGGFPAQASVCAHSGIYVSAPTPVFQLDMRKYVGFFFEQDKDSVYTLLVWQEQDKEAQDQRS